MDPNPHRTGTIFACIAGAGMAWFYRRLSPCGGCMEFPSEGRTVGFGLLAAVSAFGGVLAAGYGSVLFLGSGGASPLLADAWLLFVFAIAPALAVYLVVTLVARLPRRSRTRLRRRGKLLLWRCVGTGRKFRCERTFPLRGLVSLPVGVCLCGDDHPESPPQALCPRKGRRPPCGGGHRRLSPVDRTGGLQCSG